MIRLASARTTIVKTCRAQRLLSWIDRSHRCRSVLLIRHPVGTVASQLHFPAFSPQDIARVHPVITEAIREEHRSLVASLRGLETLHERLAATWALDYRIALDRIKPGDGMTLVFYEDLVRRPLATMELLLEETATPHDLDRLPDPGRPSATTVGDSNVATRGGRLATWRDRLTSEQADEVIDVCRRAGLELYDRDLVPRASRLFGSDDGAWRTHVGQKP